jgi:hypothetical protein
MIYLFFHVCILVKVFLFRLPEPLLFLGPCGLSSFFTGVSSTNVTGVESGLVCYSFLKCCFHHVYK